MCCMRVYCVYFVLYRLLNLTEIANCLGRKKKLVENKTYVIRFETSYIMYFEPPDIVFKNHIIRSRIDSTVGYMRHVATASQTVLIRWNPPVKLHTSVYQRIHLRCTRFNTMIMSYPNYQFNYNLTWQLSGMLSNTVSRLLNPTGHCCRPFSRFRRIVHVLVIHSVLIEVPWTR